MSETLLEIKDLTKQYGEKTALHDVDLEIDQGEFIALVGMSGGGKSTLLRLIANLESKTSGTIHYPNQQPIIRVMFQNDRLLPWLTVRENLTFNRRGDQTTLALEQKMLHRVGLEDFAQAYPAQLSGGQKQRVALARALMAKPQLLLLDEPLGALDALTRRNMQKLILEVCHEQNLTTILVTHDVEEAARMADRIIVIKNGTNYYTEVGPNHNDQADVSAVSQRILHDIMDGG